MGTAIRLGQVLLRFDAEGERSIIGDLSAATTGPDGSLWVASDELSGGRVTVSRLSPAGHGTFGGHEMLALGDFVALPDAAQEETEADLEGLDCAHGYLWFTGSHSSKRSKPRGRDRAQDLARLASVQVDANRYLLGRIPVPGGPGPEPDVRTAARLADAPGGNLLIAALQDDPHLGPFLRTQHGADASQTLLPLASKENGFDVEGLAVFDTRLFLGLRGPVLRGWATLLEIAPDELGPGLLGLAPMLPTEQRYRKHFLDLDGLGIRELARDGDDLLILAGPTMTLHGSMRLYRLRDAANLENDNVTGHGDGRLVPLFDLPSVPGGDNAEGFTLIRWREQPAILVVYDGPLDARRPADGAVFADVFWLHG